MIWLCIVHSVALVQQVLDVWHLVLIVWVGLLEFRFEWLGAKTECVLRYCLNILVVVEEALLWVVERLHRLLHVREGLVIVYLTEVLGLVGGLLVLVYNGEVLLEWLHWCCLSLLLELLSWLETLVEFKTILLDLGALLLVLHWISGSWVVAWQVWGALGEVWRRLAVLGAGVEAGTVGVLIAKDGWISLMELLENLLTMLQLNEWWLEGLDGVENLVSQVLILYNIKCSLENIVSELVVDEFLNNEVYSHLEVLRLWRLEPKLSDDLEIIIWEGTLEDLVDVRLFVTYSAWVFWIEANLNNVTGELKLTESDEVLANLHDDHFILLLVLKLENVLNQVVTIWVFDKMAHISNDVVSELKLLRLGTFLQASLHDTAAVFMLTNLNGVLHASIKDELSVLASLVTAFNVWISWMVWSLEDHEESLDHMVSMHVHCELNDVGLKGTDDLVQSVVVDALFNGLIELEILNNLNS